MSRTRKGLGSIRVSFTEGMNSGAASNSGNYSLLVRVGRRGRTIRVRSASYDAGSNTVTLIPAGKVKKGQAFTLNVSGVTDAAGNGLSGGRFSSSPLRG